VAPFSSSIRKEFISGVSSPGKVSPKSSRPHRLKRLMIHGAVGAALLASWAAVPAQALTWNWSFDGSPHGSAQGTFTTAGSTALANTLETITAITGTYTDSGGTYNITGLSTFVGAANQFQWDGTNSSPIFSDGDGISFFLDSGAEVNMYRLSLPNPGPIDRFFSKTPIFPTKTMLTLQPSLQFRFQVQSPAPSPSSAPLPPSAGVAS